MHYSPVSGAVTASPHSQNKPILNSYDSGEECSLAHLVELFRLVELVEEEDGELKRTVYDDSLLLVTK